jgi:hypothetical protein
VEGLDGVTENINDMRSYWGEEAVTDKEGNDCFTKYLNSDQ